MDVLSIPEIIFQGEMYLYIFKYLRLILFSFLSTVLN